MKRYILTFAMLGTFFGGMVSAQDRPVVLELFTSQGCSSCPPADELLHKLAKEDDIIALSLHVDYWDYIGWKDSFADPAYTQRQRSYAQRQRERMVYTPQIMVNGVEHVVGNRSERVIAALEKHRQSPPVVALAASRQGENVIIDLSKAAKPGDFIVHLVTYKPSRQVAIKRGENAGRTISYTNVVTSWRSLERWNGRKDKSIVVSATNNDQMVVIVQKRNFGEIVGSVRVN